MLKCMFIRHVHTCAECPLAIANEIYLYLADKAHLIWSVALASGCTTAKDRLSEVPCADMAKLDPKVGCHIRIGRAPRTMLHDPKATRPARSIYSDSQPASSGSVSEACVDSTR